jgi:hypothetical protein
MDYLPDEALGRVEALLHPGFEGLWRLVTLPNVQRVGSGSGIGNPRN